ncbi:MULTISPECIES: glycoside hydrolase family 5 protein [unclassified Rhizobium]|uniref:glycoside hydrolase family 5 protein n=1 Tax=unclassified Rhizobium TaxID=2613769 RepID=UPI001ADB8A7A|nr:MULTISPECIES: glycoside hydrolase family 5 protein [unclassified Rhizobium]MBO9096840.1 glycoside hydrolase family 5 protein [Rhizobium sp. L58/93]MBO9134287.1 glycoside hydrolase family 5 protein [Rhizobium sp. B209b/85]MBO9167095.1 glycoside hydrolase family 5 protein [Rhizobium sp. L245/93]MBO9183067.1 glycoside hydrolase family 5 protein [Rhizobium sp. E27B/91]QXZ83429.1 glycoside hydrolase family 5 protein [Rhizobium sp. K1/93]
MKISIAGMARRFAMLSTTLIGLVTFAGSGEAAGLCYRGINLSGAEYGDRDGVAGTDYIYPTEATVHYFAGKGMNVVRLPFLWERLQPELNEKLDDEELSRLKAAVDRIHKNGMTVVLDPHNYARYDKVTISQDPVTDDAFGDFWSRLAGAFANQPSTVFGLMNEPNDIKAPDWLKAANTAIGRIRAIGARNLILVPGTIWTGAHSWSEVRLGGGSNAEIMLGVTDPLDFYAYEFHQYLDADWSGTHALCEGTDKARTGIADVTNWLRQNHKRGFLGEFGAAGNQPCLDGLQSMLDILGKNSDVWLGWSYWAAGDWWPESEPLNVQPRKTPDRPQMALLATAAKNQRMAKACSATVK